MTTLQNRTPKGFPTGGQFAADLHGEPTTTLTPEAPEQSDPQVLRNLNRSLGTVPEITEDQKVKLRARKTPLLDAFKARGMAIFAPKDKVAPREEEPAA